MMKKLKYSLLIAATLAAAGCTNKYGAAYIVTEPSGAEIINLDDGTTIGVSPLKHVWRDEGSRKQVNLQITRPGYRPKSSSFWLTLGNATKKGAINSPQYVEIKLFSTDGSSSSSNPSDNSLQEDQLNAIQ